MVPYLIIIGFIPNKINFIVMLIEGQLYCHIVSSVYFRLFYDIVSNKTNMIEENETQKTNTKLRENWTQCKLYMK